MGLYSNEQNRNCTKKLLIARMELVDEQPFFGLLLMKMQFGLSHETQTACTNGTHIYFNPDFLLSLADSEVCFILMHEVMHVVLKHCFRRNDRNTFLFNVACDIVVNSNILQVNGMDENIIKVKGNVSMHKTPNGQEGFLYTAEQVYEMLKKGEYSSSWDDHSLWTEVSTEVVDKIDEWVKEAYSVAIGRKGRIGKGLKIPSVVKVQIDKLFQPQTDWRVVLNDFIQQEVCDYSFSPPDRRYLETGFFLPDFNATEDVIKNIMFWIDTSGSMDKDDVCRAYSEVKGAIDQFGKISGMLGFFDHRVYPPQPFVSEEEFRKIIPRGRGGTDFNVVFEYIKEDCSEEPPSVVIIITDGGADFPEENPLVDIPVLWLITNEEVTPPWGINMIL